MKKLMMKFSDERNRRFSIKTTIALDDESGEKFVLKEAAFPEGQGHLNSILYYRDLLTEYYPSVTVCPVEKRQDTLWFAFISGESLEEMYRRSAKEKDREKFLALADRKKEIHDYDLLYLVGDIDRMKQQSIALKFLQVTAGTLLPTATLVLKFGDHERMAIATGNGPVDAAVSAIKTLINEKVVLMEFLMQAITKGSNDVGRVHVQVQCGSRTVHGFAAHTDTTRASIEAFLDALRVLNVTERKEKEE